MVVLTSQEWREVELTNGEILSLDESAGVPECSGRGNFWSECPFLPSFLPSPSVPHLKPALCFSGQFELDFFFTGNKSVVNKISLYLTGTPHPSECRALVSYAIETFHLSSWGPCDIAPERLILLLPPQWQERDRGSEHLSKSRVRVVPQRTNLWRSRNAWGCPCSSCLPHGRRRQRENTPMGA